MERLWTVKPGLSDRWLVKKHSRPAAASSGRKMINCPIAQPPAPCRPPCAAGAGGGGDSGGFKPIDPAAGGKRLTVAPTVPKGPPKDLRETEAVGPRGLLLVGFSAEDGERIRAWFRTMEPGFAVSHCPAAALQEGGPATLAAALGLEPLPGSGSGSSEAAQQAQQQGPQRLAELPWEAAPAWVPPVAFFSGMAGPEVVGVLEHWQRCTGLEPPAFAAVTEGTLRKPLWRLVKDIVRSVGRAEAGAPAAAAPAAAGAVPEGSGAVEAGLEGGSEGLGSKLKEFVMLGPDGTAQSEPMDVGALREQLRRKVEERKAEQAAAEARAKQKAKKVDEDDRVRAALLESRKGAGGGGKGSKGFGGAAAKAKPKPKGFGA